MKFTKDGAIDIDDPDVWPDIDQVQSVRAFLHAMHEWPPASNEAMADADRAVSRCSLS